MSASFIMIEFNKKRERIRCELRRQQQQSYFQAIRQQLIEKQHLRQYLCETEQLLVLAYIKSQAESPDFFNIYVNIQRQLHDVLNNCSGLDFISKLAIWLYLQLTSSPTVLEYLLQPHPSQQWRFLIFLLTKFHRCEEYVYDRMRVFLQKICARRNISPYHTLSQYRYGQQLFFIFSTETTQKIADLPIPIDEQSQYYDFVSLYVSLMPTCHILRLITQGFPQLFIHCPNNSVLLTFIGRLELLCKLSSQYKQDLANLSDLLHQKHEIKLIQL